MTTARHIIERIVLDGHNAFMLPQGVQSFVVRAKKGVKMAFETGGETRYVNFGKDYEKHEESARQGHLYFKGKGDVEIKVNI